MATRFYKNYRIDIIHNNNFNGRYKLTYTTPTGREKVIYTNDSLIYDAISDMEADISKADFEEIRAMINGYHKNYR